MEKVFSTPEFDIMWDYDEEAFFFYPSEARDCPLVTPEELYAAARRMENFYADWLDHGEPM